MPHSIERSKPIQLLWDLLSLEGRDIGLLIGYGVLVSVLSLSAPLAIDMLVTTIAAGTVTLPLIVLALATFVALALAGGLGIVQQFISEIIERRIFIRIACRTASTLWDADTRSVGSLNLLSLLNRFFDVVTVQKLFTKLVLSFITVALAILTGLVLLSLFSPILAIIAFVMVAAFSGALFLFGHGALTTNIDESTAKYAVADVLDEVGTNIISYKIFATPSFILDRFDNPLRLWLDFRKKHWRILVRQQIVAASLKIVMIVALLLAGGLLVINRQISLGQLVASQVVILLFLNTLEGFIKQVPDIYALLTSLTKINQLTSLHREHNGTEQFRPASGIAVSLSGITFSFSHGRTLLRDLSLEIPAGDRLCIVGRSGEGKSILARIIAGIAEPERGTVLLNNHELRTIERLSLRRYIGFVDTHDEIIAGTVLDNIVFGRKDISPDNLQWAVEIAHLQPWLDSREMGLLTPVRLHDKSLSTGQLRRIALARAIVNRPALLIIDDGFNGLEDNVKLSIVEEILNPIYPWTVIIITHDLEIVSLCSRVAVLEEGRIIELGRVSELSDQKTTVFSELFPNISTHVRTSPSS